MKVIKNKKEAIDIILDQKIIAIFPGHSEWGARALGNRSFLFDPRNPKAKEIVNKFKDVDWNIEELKLNYWREVFKLKAAINVI